MVERRSGNLVKKYLEDLNYKYEISIFATPVETSPKLSSLVHEVVQGPLTATTGRYVFKATEGMKQRIQKQLDKEKIPQAYYEINSLENL